MIRADGRSGDKGEQSNQRGASGELGAYEDVPRDEAGDTDRGEQRPRWRASCGETGDAIREIAREGGGGEVEHEARAV